MFIDEVDGTKADRPNLAAALTNVHEGDQLAIWRLDRVGRSMPHLVTVVTELGGRGVGFQSLTEGIDTAAPGGELVLHIFDALTQFDRALNIERARRGPDAARAKDARKGGRRPVLTPDKLATARAMLATGEHTMYEIATAVGVSRATLYRRLTPADDG